MKPERISAIILSAGFSSRMQGYFKPLLSVGGLTVLERAVCLFRNSGISDICVVTGHRAADLSPVIEKLGVRTCFNPEYESGMFSSVSVGVAALHPDKAAFFMLPVDIPLVRPNTVNRLLNARQNGYQGVLYPCFDGERGHPPLIPAEYARGITEWTGEGGLRAFLEQYDDTASDVAVVDELMLMDMDTPGDYENIVAKWSMWHNIPTVRECMFSLSGIAEPVSRHCQAVAHIARNLGQALNAAGCRVNVNLIFSAALLHDLARTEPHHAEAGARRLREMGFPEVADIVAVHMDIVAGDGPSVSEAEVVFLADKLVRGDRPCSIEQRFQAKMKKYGDRPEVRDGILRRQENARRIMQRIEAITGQTVEALSSYDLSDAPRRD